MAKKIFMDEQAARTFAKSVSGTVEKEPIESIWINNRPTGYVVTYSIPTKVNKPCSVL